MNLPWSKDYFSSESYMAVLTTSGSHEKNCTDGPGESKSNYGPLSYIIVLRGVKKVNKDTPECTYDKDSWGMFSW